MFKFLSKDTPKADIGKKATAEVIQRAYRRREKDIDSLRQYDRGEKEIHAPNIRDIMPNLRRTS